MPKSNLSNFDSTVVKYLLQLNEQGPAGGDVSLPTAPQIGDSPTGPGTLPTGEMPEPKDATTPVDEPDADAEDKTPTPEGVVFLINLIKKAFWLDPNTVDLSGFQTNLLTKKVTPKNAEEVLDVLKKIIDDAGLLEIPAEDNATRDLRDE
jgi:hypothetical protein